MWRFGWVFFLLTLFFETLAFFTGFIACCGRLGSAVSGLMTTVALAFSTISCVLMTYVYSPLSTSYSLLPTPASLNVSRVRFCPLPASNTFLSVTFVKARDAFNRADRDAKVGTYAFAFAWASWAALLLATVLFCIGVRGDKGHHRKSGGRFRRRRSRRSYDGRRVKEEYN